MLPALLSLLGSVIPSVLDRVLPGESPEVKAKKMELEGELMKAVQAINLKQLEINEAEAANPNRQWPTWREALGYICVFAVGYHFILQPFLVFALRAAQVDIVPPTLELGNLMTILTGMLGIHFVDSRYNSAPGEMYIDKPAKQVGGSGLTAPRPELEGKGFYNKEGIWVDR